MRTSLGSASLGLLDRGNGESLHMASIGLLRYALEITISGTLGGKQFKKEKIDVALQNALIEDKEIIEIITALIASNLL